MTPELFQWNKYLNIPNYIHKPLIIIVCYLFIYHTHLKCSKINELCNREQPSTEPQVIPLQPSISWVLSLDLL